MATTYSFLDNGITLTDYDILKYKLGDRVRHTTYGPGVIVRVDYGNTVVVKYDTVNSGLCAYSDTVTMDPVRRYAYASVSTLSPEIYNDGLDNWV